MKQYVLSVNCASGVESVLKRELIALGLGEQKAVNGSFVFEGDANAVATCNMFLHTAEHVYLQLSQFEARDFDALFDGIYSIGWADYVTVDAQVIVNAKSVKSDLFALVVTCFGNKVSNNTHYNISCKGNNKICNILGRK